MVLSAVNPISIVSRTVWGNKRIVLADITLGNATWPAGGLSFVPAQLGLEGFDIVLITGKKLGYYYDYTNEKIDAYLPGVATGEDEPYTAANGVTPNETVRVVAIG